MELRKTILMSLVPDRYLFIYLFYFILFYLFFFFFEKYYREWGEPYQTLSSIFCFHSSTQEKHHERVPESLSSSPRNGAVLRDRSSLLWVSRSSLRLEAMGLGSRLGSRLGLEQ